MSAAKRLAAGLFAPGFPAQPAAGEVRRPNAKNQA